MNNFAPSLPSLSLEDLPSDVLVDALTGYLYARITKRNPILMVTIFTIRTVAHTLFYRFFDSIIQGDQLKSQKVFLTTSCIINTIFFMTLRELNLIGTFVSCLLGISFAGLLINRITYIQEQEKKLLAHKK